MCVCVCAAAIFCAVFTYIRLLLKSENNIEIIKSIYVRMESAQAADGRSVAPTVEMNCIIFTSLGRIKCAR